MKIPVWLLNYNLIKSATAKLFISAQINYHHEIPGKSAKGFGRIRRQIWCCGVKRGVWWMPGKGKNLISLLKSAQKCWRVDIYINLILQSQGLEGKFLRCFHQAPEGSIQWIREKTGPHRTNHLVTNPKGFGFVAVVATWELWVRKPRKCRKSSGATWVWRTNLKLQGWGKGVPSLPHTFSSSQEAPESPEALQHLTTTISWDKA